MAVDDGGRWRRSTAVVARVAPDRVLVRRVGGPGLDLMGIAAMAWVVLDQPRSLTEVAAELLDIDPSISSEAVRATLRELVAAGLVERIPS